jgi:hypothetical protein
MISKKMTSASSMRQYPSRNVCIDMKRLIAMLCSVMLGNSGFAQGQVMFNNLDRAATPNIDAKVYDVRT